MDMSMRRERAEGVFPYARIARKSRLNRMSITDMEPLAGHNSSVRLMIFQAFSRIR